jgi:hypothetical protein
MENKTANCGVAETNIDLHTNELLSKEENDRINFLTFSSADQILTRMEKELGVETVEIQPTIA